MNQTITPPPVDDAALMELLGRIVVDAGATMSSALVVIGDKLGLYRALNEGPMTAAELADRTGTAERYVREWLSAQAAGGYVSFDPATERFSLTPEQALAFATPGSPVDLPGLFQLVTSVVHDEPKITEVFRSGDGVGWHEHDHGLFEGTERFFRASYSGSLIGQWLPALDGVVEKLQAGASVADVGCGHGASTILMAQAFPNSRLHGFDYHDRSIATARKRAAEAGVDDRVRFDVAPASGFTGSGYDLVTFFDCLHDMGDPVGAAAHVRESLAPDGTWMIVEPFAGDRLQDNLNPVGRLFYAASTLIDRKSTRLNSSHIQKSRMPSSA